ncbi:MAG: hypothetical protein C4584_02725 [Armatimonadetes bacterium]|nr:MAG: hypothetical protein C4584_02725 [Armatimonadota bacterium]
MQDNTTPQPPQQNTSPASPPESAEPQTPQTPPPPQPQTQPETISTTQPSTPMPQNPTFQTSPLQNTTLQNQPSQPSAQQVPPNDPPPPQSSDPRLYPDIQIKLIENPNRLYAIPMLGFIFKTIILLPVFIWIYILSFATFILNFIINPFVVLFTGKYWPPAYEFYMGILRLSAKISFYFAGLTNKYPGFSFSIDDPLLSVNIPIPQNPNRLFATPILGGTVRIILLIPFIIYSSIIGYAAFAGLLIGWAPVLSKGTYMESVYEIIRDWIRLQFAQSAYIVGFSDTYPTFKISMNHKAAKIIFIVLGILLLLLTNIPQSNSPGY